MGDDACISSSAPTRTLTDGRIGNAIAVDGVGVGSPSRVEELDCQFEEERRGWERRAQNLEKEVRRLRCEGKQDEGRHEDGSRIDPRGDIVVNRVEGADEGVAPIDPVFELRFRKGCGGLERGFRRREHDRN